MKAGAAIIIQIFDIVKDNLPNSKRAEVALGIVRAFEEYGFESSEISEIADEDKHLAQAYIDIYDIEDEPEYAEDDE